jgi:hypothetical protein
MQLLNKQTNKQTKQKSQEMSTRKAKVVVSVREEQGEAL